MIFVHVTTSVIDENVQSQDNGEIILIKLKNFDVSSGYFE